MYHLLLFKALNLVLVLVIYRLQFFDELLAPLGQSLFVIDQLEEEVEKSLASHLIHVKEDLR